MGVNGDYFSLASEPAELGMFMRDGVVFPPPGIDRLALALRFDGRLVVDALPLRGLLASRDRYPGIRLRLNKLPLKPPGVALVHAHARGQSHAERAGLGRARVHRLPAGARNGSHREGHACAATAATAIPPAGAVIQARGMWRGRMLAGAPVGAPMTVRLRIPGLPDGARDAIGGGPVLVRDGNPVQQADEQFTPSHLNWRQPRTAVGQLGDGSLIFVVADGAGARFLAGCPTGRWPSRWRISAR